jgi:Sugar (and other) transporter.
MSTAAPAATGERTISAAEKRRVIVASSVGTVFEWYDFYLYATLAPFFASLFFPKGNATAALLSAFVTYAAGFLVRPFGAIVFGRIGDLVGRKYTFIMTISVMAGATALIGFLPTFETVGWFAPFFLVLLRLAQGLALGGEYGGAATYVAEHAADEKRGYATSWIQTTATVGFFLSLAVIGTCRTVMSPADFSNWGWRIPFVLSLFLLAISLYIRIKLQESPIFQRMKAQGRGSRSPIKDSFFKYPNNKFVPSRSSAPPRARAWSGTRGSSTRCSSSPSRSRWTGRPPTRSSPARSWSARRSSSSSAGCRTASAG